MDNNDFIIRLSKIKEKKTVKEKKEEFLETEYQYPSFINLYKTIKIQANNLKSYGLELDISLINSDSFHLGADVDDRYRKDMIYMQGEHSILYIVYFEKLSQYWIEETDECSGGEEYSKYYGINIFQNHQDKDLIKTNYFLSVDDDLNIVWGGNNNEALSNIIFDWFIENLEND